MRWFIFIAFIVSGSASAQPEDPTLKGPCISGPFILVRGVPQHLKTTTAETRAFLSRETGDSPPDTSQYFQIKKGSSVVQSLRFLPDASGGLILAQTPCGDRVPLDDAEVLEYMTAIFKGLRQLRTLPAAVTMQALPQELDKTQPNQPLHPTTQAAEPPSSPGERRRYTQSQ